MDQILNEIERSKNNPLWRFLYGLSIPNIGIESAKNLAAYFQDLLKLFEAPSEVLQDVPLVGSCAAQSLKAFYNNPENKRIVDLLLKSGLKLTVDEINDQGVWSGKLFVLTGTLAHMKRNEAKQAIERLGGRVVETVSSKVSAIIVGDNPGDKLQKGRSLNLAFWTEVDFLKNLEHASD